MVERRPELGRRCGRAAVEVGERVAIQRWPKGRHATMLPQENPMREPAGDAAVIGMKKHLHSHAHAPTYDGAMVNQWRGDMPAVILGIKVRRFW